MINEIKIIHLRKSFFEIVQFLTSNHLNYWLGRGLIEQIDKGIIDDDENHDIDFHVLVENKDELKKSLATCKYKIRQDEPYKIQVLGKSDNRKIEFVFLEKQDENYIHQSRDIRYVNPQKLFGDHTCKIVDTIVKIPWPIKEYFGARKKKLGIKS